MHALLRRARRIFALSVGLYLLVQLVAQAALEVRFPFTVRLGPFTAVVFIDAAPEARRAAGD